MLNFEGEILLKKLISEYFVLSGMSELFDLKYVKKR